MPRKLTKSLTNEQAARELGYVYANTVYSDTHKAKRVFRHPGGKRGELPDFLNDIRASIAECERRGARWQMWKREDGIYEAQVWVATVFCGIESTSASALLAALLKFVKFVKKGGR